MLKRRGGGGVAAGDPQHRLAHLGVVGGEVDELAGRRHRDQRDAVVRLQPVDELQGVLHHRPGRAEADVALVDQQQDGAARRLAGGAVGRDAGVDGGRGGAVVARRAALAGQHRVEQLRCTRRVTTLRGLPSTSTWNSAGVRSGTWRPSRSSTVTSIGSTSTPVRNTGGCSARRPAPGPRAAAPGPAARRLRRWACERRGDGERRRRRRRRGLGFMIELPCGRRRGRRQPRRPEPAAPPAARRRGPL